MAPFRVDLAEYDGSTTSLPRLLGEALVFLAALFTVAALLWAASA